MLRAADNAEFLQRLNIDPATMESFAGIAPWIIIDLLFGLLVVWAYAAIRPRWARA